MSDRACQRGILRRGLVLAALLAAAGVAPGASGLRATIGSDPAPVREWRDGGRVIATLPPGAAVEIVEEGAGWYQVLLPPDGFGTRRGGWLLARYIVTENDRPVPVVDVVPPPVAREPQDPARASVVLAIGGRVVGPAADLTSPPPVSPVPWERFAGRWVSVRALRANIGVGYERIGLEAGDSFARERGLSQGLGIATTLSFLDPRILSVDLAADLQAMRARRTASTYAVRNDTGLRNYRVSATILSGRGSPFRLFADRVSSDATVRTRATGDEALQRTAGTRTGKGLAWDLNLGGLPRFQMSASTSRQIDRRDYLFGFASENRERRAEIRATRDFARARFDASYSRGDFTYLVPEAGVRSDTANDLASATARVTPVSGLAVDVNARVSQFRFGVDGATNVVRGVGGDLGVRWDLTSRVSAATRASVSTNAFEATLAGAVAADSAGLDRAAGGAPFRTRTAFVDVDSRIGYSSRPFTLELSGRLTSFGIPDWQPVALETIRRATLSMRAERELAGLVFLVGGDVAAGTAGSNRHLVEPYREGGAVLGVSRAIPRLLRVSVEGSVRRTGRLSFYPVVLFSRSLAGRFETDLPAWARLRATASYSQIRRDVLYSDAADGHLAWTLGVGGPWYDLSFDVSRSDTNSLLLPASILGTRLEAEVLLASRPDLFHDVFGASDMGRAATLRLTPASWLELRGRFRRARQRYPGLYELRLEEGQVWAVIELRQLQLELGWESLLSFSNFAAPSDRRLFVRIRRAVTLF